MKKMLIILFAIAALLVSCAPAADGTDVSPAASAAPASAGNTAPNNSAEAPAAFTVTSAGIVDGYIDPAYGQNGASVENGIPTLSIPIDISGAPAGTACYALYMDDPDSEPLCGYAWVHWMAANFTQSSLPEGFSAAAGGAAVQGRNDSGTAGYAGPTPPDKDHTYRITVYALAEPLDLRSGFSKEQFAAALEGRVLAEVTLEGIYKK